MAFRKFTSGAPFLKKETMQFSLIYVGHRNENILTKATVQFSETKMIILCDLQKQNYDRW